ncbi:hypothetical protein GBA52_024339 [Prunus armeniaca]|nr:hypothetical protein GBA52_024339 [Prunus armeniaca]
MSSRTQCNQASLISQLAIAQGNRLMPRRKGKEGLCCRRQQPLLDGAATLPNFLSTAVRSRQQPVSPSQLVLVAKC